MVEIKSHQLLANAIVHRAAVDYQKALCGIGTSGPNMNAESVIKDCEAFFKGDWIRMLTALDGVALMQALQREAREYGYDWPMIRKAHGLTNEEE